MGTSRIAGRKARNGGDDDADLRTAERLLQPNSGHLATPAHLTFDVCVNLSVWNFLRFSGGIQQVFHKVFSCVMLARTRSVAIIPGCLTTSFHLSSASAAASLSPSLRLRPTAASSKSSSVESTVHRRQARNFAVHIRRSRAAQPRSEMSGER